MKTGRTELDPRDSVDAVRFARERLGFDPDPVQTELLRSGTKRGLLNCTRQWGKSTVTAILALHFALTHEEATVIVASPSARQSGEFLRKVRGFARRLGERGRGDGDNAISVMLGNGSRVVGLPGKEDTIRGFSNVGLMLIDEAAWVPDELYWALRPMLAASDGGVWLMSTPAGKRGFFYREWSKGEGWERFEVKGWDCPRFSKTYLESERGWMEERVFRQEYECAFTEMEGQWLEEDVMEKVWREDWGPVW